MKKKIGLILPTKPWDGGQHQYALLVVNCLLEKADTDYDLVVLCGTSFWRKWCREKNIKFLGYPIPDIPMYERKFNIKYSFLAKLYYTYFTQLGKVIMREKIQILFIVHQGLFVPNYNVKIIAPVHDLMHRYEPDFPEVSNSLGRDVLMKSFAKYSTCVLVDSKLGKKQFEESYIQGHGRRTHVISLPFTAPEHVWDSKEEIINIPDRYIFYPAQFWKHKNHINLLKAINILHDTFDDIHLILVGSDKNNGREIRKYISDNALDKYITILGFVSNEAITYLYRHAVGMVMPSYFGPTNIPPLEAMALGCPVAVSNKYAMPEQVGNAGLLFNPDSPEEIADCIKEMWTNEALRERMKQLGYKRIQGWTKKEFSKRLFKIIDTF